MINTIIMEIVVYLVPCRVSVHKNSIKLTNERLCSPLMSIYEGEGKRLEGITGYQISTRTKFESGIIGVTGMRERLNS